MGNPFASIEQEMAKSGLLPPDPSHSVDSQSSHDPFSGFEAEMASQGLLPN
jgi:hypothetical protein